MRGRPSLILCVLLTFLMISAGALTFAEGVGGEERSAAEEQAEIDALKLDLLEAAHAAAGAEKKDFKQESVEREAAASRPGGIIIGFDRDLGLLDDLLAPLAAAVDELIPELGMAVVTLPESSFIDDAIAFIEGLPGVKWAEPDYLKRSLYTPNDTYVGQQWYLGPINAYAAWDKAKGDPGTIMAVVDSGINRNHEDLVGVPGRVLAGYNTFTGGAVTSDYNGHGTWVAGVAAADTDNAKGIAGIDWNAQILPIAVDNGTIPVSNSVQGIKYAADHGADVINMSYGGLDYSQAEREAVDYAREKGCVLVAARGNDGEEELFFPSCLANVIGVGASNKTGDRADFSDFGFGTDVMAPGVEIYGPQYNNIHGYMYGDGTSFAAPLVSGEAGLILDNTPGINPRQLEWRIEESAQGSGTWSKQMGFGIIDIRGALDLPGSGYQDSMEPNDTVSQARDVTTGYYQSFISCNSDIDVYHIQPDMSGYGSFGLLNIPEGCDYELTLYEGGIDDSENGTWIAYSYNSGNTPEVILEAPMQKGQDYYIAVESYGGYSTQQPYDLLVLEPTISGSWFFAEGYTGTGFEEWLCVQNPGDAAANVEVLYMFEDGQDTKSYGVDPHSRRTINVNDEVNAGRNVSAALSSSTPVVAERPMYFDYKGKWQGGHDVVGARTPFYYWYFAEGYTGPGFEEWLCLQNPNESTISATVTFMFEGEAPLPITYDLGPLSRFTLNVNETVGADKNVSIKVESEDALVAERPMYFDYKGSWRGGHDIVGVTMPSYSWFFAEGYTGPGFEEWLCLQNPFPQQAEVDIFYITSDGQVFPPYELSIPGNSRKTVDVNKNLGEGYEVSVAIFSDDAPIVAERPMYFNYKGKWDGGHDSQGCTSPSYSWYFAEGTTRPGFEEWLCLQNPGEETARITVEYMLGTGQTIPRNYEINPYSRFTIDVVEQLGLDKDVAIRIESNVPVVAERPMYFDYKGSWRGGHDTIGYVPGD